jgi:thiol-disulfide isomerase/thioredoxin
MVSIKTILQTSFFLALGFLACNNTSQKTTEQPGQPETPATVTSTDAHAAKRLPTFKMINHAGDTVDLADFAGKKVFLNLWATWCPPCRREMPSIQSLYNSVDTSKVAFVMVALDDAFDKSKSWAAAQKYNLPLYYPAPYLPEMLNVPSIPTTFIFNESGQLMDKIEGSVDYNTDKFRQLLK